MLPTFLTVLATTLSLLIVDILFRGVVIANFPAALIAGAVIGFLNGSLKPVLSAFSLPLNFATFGGFSLIVNGFCFWLAAALVPGFGVHGIAAFILGPVILSLANTFINNYFVEKNVALKGSENKAQLPSS
ncbi:membrane protein [Dulcicalothrix desertica PCC 7102]|uniref:Membrane protein n=1 Tax=Dulcicalothrix desertica PCC 7102 TaxID=232991 RepID=A0A3S1CCN4_9CYAN|nr:phage holin family protein [Dulcicalothrix desertica]RUS99189.1 membrane protein [Dulcicalothrix desertica PCC 7102]TWH61043.1 putative membrane protein [Dulcicalothrix desertica PCC 7102]